MKRHQSSEKEATELDKIFATHIQSLYLEYIMNFYLVKKR